MKRLNKPALALTEQQYLQGGFPEPIDVLFDIDIGVDDRSAQHGKVLIHSRCHTWIVKLIAPMARWISNYKFSSNLLA